MSLKHLTANGMYSFPLPAGIDFDQDLLFGIRLRREGTPASAGRIFTILNSDQSRGLIMCAGGSTGNGDTIDLRIACGSGVTPTGGFYIGDQDNTGNNGRGNLLTERICDTGFDSLLIPLLRPGSTGYTGSGGANQLGDVYRNRQLVNNFTNTQFGLVPGPGGFYTLFGREEASLSAWQGYIAELIIWQGILNLSASDRALYFNGGDPSAIQSANVILYHPLRDSVGAVIGYTTPTSYGTAPTADNTVHPSTGAPGLVGKTAFESGTAGVSPDFSSTGRVSGDLLILVCETANEVVSTPSGWTLVPDTPSDNGGTAAAIGSVRLTMFYKVSDGTETTVSIADPGNHIAAIGLVYRGQKASGFIGDTATTFNAAETAIDFPDITTTMDMSLIQFVAATDRDSTATNSFTGSTFVSNTIVAQPTEQVDNTTASGAGGGFGVFTGIKPTAGALGVATVTAGNSEENVLHTMEIGPEPTPAAPSAPSGLAASNVATTTADLNWTDNSGDETGFHIQVSTSSGFTTGVQNVFKAGGVTSHSLTGLASNTTYYARVRALKAGAPSSAWANLSGTTFTTSGGTVLTIAETSHAHSAEAPKLTVSLQPADTSHAHTADQSNVSSTPQLTIADSTHSHIADSVTLVSPLALAIADAAHAHTVDGLTIVPEITVTRPFDRGRVDLTQTALAIEGGNPHLYLYALPSTDYNESATGDSRCQVVYAQVDGILNTNLRMKVIPQGEAVGWRTNDRIMWRPRNSGINGWQYFDNHTGGAAVPKYGWMNSPWAYDSIDVAFNLPFPLGEMNSWVDSLIASGYAVEPASSVGGGAYYYAQLDGSLFSDDRTGGTLAAATLRQRCIELRDPSATVPAGRKKALVVLTSNMHASEDAGTHAMRWVVQEWLDNVEVRKRIDLLLYPTLVPSGRFVGRRRGTSQTTALAGTTNGPRGTATVGEDPNREFPDVGTARWSIENSNTRAAIAADNLFNRLRDTYGAFIDWHTDGVGSDPSIFVYVGDGVSDDTREIAWVNASDAYITGTVTKTTTNVDSIRQYFTDTGGLSFTCTVEFAYNTANLIAFVEEVGRGMAKGFIDTFDAGNLGGYVLSPADTVHSNTAENLAITTTWALNIADATHGHTAEPLVLSQSQFLSVADSTHSHTADNLALAQHHGTLVVAEALHAHTTDNLTLVQGLQLFIADAVHAHNVDAANLTQRHTLVIAEASHSHTVDQVNLSQATQLTVADAVHAHTAESLALQQNHGNLVISDAVHSHTAENVTLTLATQLAIADTVHAHITNGPTLKVRLLIADATHAHVADNVTLAFGAVLTINDTQHGVSSDNLTLTQRQVLAVADSSHAHTAEVPTLSQRHTLVIADSIHSHVAENVTLVQGMLLLIDSTLHVVVSDSPNVVFKPVLQIASCRHDHLTDSVWLGVSLRVAEAFHQQSAKGLTLSQSSFLAIQDAIHNVLSDNMALVSDGVVRLTDPDQIVYIELPANIVYV